MYDFAKRISEKTKELYHKKHNLAGEFTNFVSGSDLDEMYPDKGKKIMDLEREIALLKSDLNRPQRPFSSCDTPAIKPHMTGLDHEPVKAKVDCYYTRGKQLS